MTVTFLMSFCPTDAEGRQKCNCAVRFILLHQRKVAKKKELEMQTKINPYLGLAFGCCVAPAVAVVCGLTSSSANK